MPLTERWIRSRLDLVNNTDVPEEKIGIFKRILEVVSPAEDGEIILAVMAADEALVEYMDIVAELMNQQTLAKEFNDHTHHVDFVLKIQREIIGVTVEKLTRLIVDWKNRGYSKNTIMSFVTTQIGPLLNPKTYGLDFNDPSIQMSYTQRSFLKFLTDQKEAFSDFLSTTLDDVETES